MFCACEHTNDSKWRQILQYSDFIRKEHLHVVDKISVESVHFRVFEYKELVYHIHAGGIDIWEKKYRYKNEDFDGWLDRVSGGNQNIRKLIEEKKFLAFMKQYAH